jgi:hypothetical protein
MLVAYVSDERYVALPDVILEFEGDAGSFEARSRASGSVHVDLPSGTYKVTLQNSGFGAKSVRVDIAAVKSWVLAEECGPTRQGHERRRRRRRAGLLRNSQRRRGLFRWLDRLAQRDPDRRLCIANHGECSQAISFINYSV